MPANCKIKVEFYEDGDYVNWGQKDLMDNQTYQLLFMAFGNGLIDEIRIVGETKAGVIAFCNMMEVGGYRRAQNPTPRNVKLYQAGDICYPQESPFVFVSPVAENGERIDFDHFQSEKDALLGLLEKDREARHLDQS